MEIETFNSVVKYINKYNLSINQAIDAGSRDLFESNLIAERFNCKVLAIEANPEAIEICKKNHKNKNITLVTKAINSFKGECIFYPINKEKTISPHEDKNIGASSLFLSMSDYPYEKYIQDKIIVPCDTLENMINDNNIKQVDLLWIDLQGAALIALESLGKYLKDIKIIQTEIETRAIYKGENLFFEVNQFLENNGFTKLYGNKNCEWFDNFIYINNNYLY